MHKKKYLIVGNWKMHGLVSWSALVKKIDQFSTKIRKKNKCRIVICPPSTLLHRFANEIKCKELMTGAQDCHELKNGAFTGCISANMLKNCGAKFVITGHSERRHIYNEDDKLISKKIIAIQKSSLSAILCVGETLNERRKGLTEKVISNQLKISLPLPRNSSKIVVAYEPVWSIGTGKVATTKQVDEVNNIIRFNLIKTFGSRGKTIKIIYGGSVNEKNAKYLAKLENLDGVLVGGASLKFGSFSKIINSFNHFG